MKKLNAIFMGNPEFSLPVLNQLKNHPKINLELVCGGIDKKVGRGHKLKSPATIEFAKINNLPFLQCENINKSEEFFELASSKEIDLIIVFAFSHFLGTKILELPSIGCFNIHTSLLPKYRGSSPIHYALLNGDTKTGVCVQKMVKKMDAGDILYQEEISIESEDNYETLCHKFSNILPSFTDTFINQLSNNSASYTKQNENDVTFAPLIKKEEGLIIANTDSSTTVINKLRALKIWPGVYIFINNMRYKILEVKKSDTLLPTGSIRIIDKSLKIGLKDTTIDVIKLQPPGKKPLLVGDFINGFNKDQPLELTDGEL